MEEDVKEEVVESSPAIEEEVVETPEVDQQDEVVVEPTVADIATDVAPALAIGQDDDIDEMGVPYKNRFHEYKRKYDTVEQKLTELNSKIEQVAQPQTKQYSEAELKAFKSNNPEYEVWADTELEKLGQQKRIKEFNSILDARDKEQNNKIVKQQTFTNVINQYPDIAIKDNAGNFLGFNNKSPMFQRLNAYMQNPEIVKNPRGLDVAAALAYRDVNLNNSQKAKQKMTKQKAEIKSLQKQTLVEGSGKVAQPTASDAQARLRQSGSVQDGMDALGDVFKKQGVL